MPVAITILLAQCIYFFLFHGVKSTLDSHGIAQSAANDLCIGFCSGKTFMKTKLYRSTKLAFWENQLSGYGKCRNCPVFIFHLLIFVGSSFWSYSLCGFIFLDNYWGVHLSSNNVGILEFVIGLWC